jgi:hypothetical protein
MRNMKVLACAVVVAAMLGMVGARSTEAACRWPPPGISPASGTVLPPRATVYQFVPRRGDIDSVLSDGLEVEGAIASVQRIATMPAYDVVRIDLTATSPEVTVRWQAFHETGVVEVRYPIGAVAASDAQMVSITHTRHHWTCSATDVIRMAGNAIAYRIEWWDGTVSVMPAGLDMMWRGLDAARATHELTIGNASCLVATTEPRALQRSCAFVLVALFADGTELRFPRARGQILTDPDPTEVIELPWELLPSEGRTMKAHPPCVAAEKRLEPKGGERICDPGPALSWIGALAGLITAFAMARWWLRRADRDAWR